MKSKFVCPVCRAGEGFRFVERCGDYALYYCPSCDLVFSDPMKTQGGGWYDKAYIVRHIAVDDRIMWYFSWALKNLPKKGKLLDIGCGAGTFVAYASKEGYEASGIDFSVEAIEAGKRRFGIESLFATTLEEFRRGQPHEIFDAITSFEVLEHVESPALFLGEMKELLKPGGRIALSVPNRDRWPVREFNDYPPHHLTQWSERSLRRLLEALGFEILQIERTPIPLSINFFYGYLVRILLYKILNLYAKGLVVPKGETSPNRSTSLEKIGRLGSKMRRLRDALMWIPTILTLPIFYPFFEGYNIVALARRGA
ncbi:MAG: methyltransferase domain-containing protein [Nitrospinota bacterium]